MNAEELIQMISDNNLIVRRLPFETVSCWICEKDQAVYQKDGEIQEVIYNDKTNRYNLKVTRTVKNGGKWLLVQCKDTSSMIQFSLKHDIVADTLNEAVELWLNKH